ncbi:maltooligosyl trehalose hydrolase [Palleronia aestuarii]|uniref:1,4-alpha-glucan branching enzyme n=1 Tax=Palleronia aestuarii TaxID=568105 RepID=A0A2W7NL01_9RHOB|nr:alpha-amylase family glycosyl hydrolase [Palleronia aestuarii]PZX18787.1 maltooligosyl trehalose hydrolase [Palleronia aestuarii]
MNMISNAETAHPGMGAIVHDGGVAFRVWAPNAGAVHVAGDFNEWSEDAAPMHAEEDGYWYADVAGASVGQEYRFLIDGPNGKISRIDPYAREVTNSVGNAVIPDPDYDWEGDAFEMPAWNRLVIYELHIGTFNSEEGEVGTFAAAQERFGHLRSLGINAIQIMPAAEFAGDVSWGYNPAHVFAIETAYGGPRAFRDFVKAAHAEGFAVILDVVYNHFGPSDLDLWQFDGWSEDDKGGVYFYQDHRANTPWGETRPDYGRPQVRQFIRDNAMHWLEEYHVDGLRFDMTLYIRNIEGHETEEDSLPDGWSLLQMINAEMAERFPGRITIAEDLREKDALTDDTGNDGAGFGAQWDAAFVHPIRETLIAESDEERSMETVAAALGHSYNGDPFQRVVYTESHDEVANGKARVPHEIGGDEQDHWAAQKRSTLGAALVFTAPGIPMLFQGQEFLAGDWFDDTVPLDWAQSEDFGGIVRLYRDLIALRLDAEGECRGLSGSGFEVIHLDDTRKTLAFRRWNGEEDGVLVVLNFSGEARDDLTIGCPMGGAWRLQLNSDWSGYSGDFGNHQAQDFEPVEEPFDNRPFNATLAIGPYTALVYSR